MAESNTAEADMSFTFFITKLKSGQTRSHSFSMAEFIISKLRTTAKHNKMIAHSNDESRRKKTCDNYNNGKHILDAEIFFMEDAIF